MRITDTTYLPAFRKELTLELGEVWNRMDLKGREVDLEYRTRASAVFSSNIEGNSIDLNSFMNSLLSKQTFKPGKELQEIQDLVKAYEYAQSHPLTEGNMLEAHRISSQTLLVKDKRGRYRNDRMGVFDHSGLVYLAVEPEFVEEKMGELFADIGELLEKELELDQLFYHAGLIHLVFAHIHPLWDGNGRTARLLEKWFLSQKLNSTAWKLQSERFYKEHLPEYYAAIHLGVNYYELDYDRCLPFLMFWPQILEMEATA